jgi:hypothetical protein
MGIAAATMTASHLSTHRIAGPAYRLARSLQSAAQRDYMSGDKKSHI